MKLQICAVFDNQAGHFGRPIFDAAVGIAMRNFTDEINRNAQDNVMFHHCGDFALFHLGEYDTADGAFELYGKPQLVADGLKVKTTVAPDQRQDHLALQ